jgi:hypothetical protein
MTTADCRSTPATPLSPAEGRRRDFAARVLANAGCQLLGAQNIDGLAYRSNQTLVWSTDDAMPCTRVEHAISKAASTN